MKENFHQEARVLVTAKIEESEEMIDEETTAEIDEMIVEVTAMIEEIKEVTTQQKNEKVFLAKKTKNFLTPQKNPTHNQIIFEFHKISLKNLILYF